MKVMIIGGSCSLLNSLIRRLNKDGHSVSLLTGMRFGDERPYERVYNRYDFSYDSVGIGRVFASASPDLTIYMGAFDANYAWNTDKMKADAYAAGVVSILSAFAGLNKGRLVYLSSQQVYDGVYAAPVGEEEPLSPKNPSALALAHGEDICRSYTRSADVMVLRLDNVYHVPQTADDCTDAIASLCRQGLMEGFVTVSQEKEFSLLAEGGRGTVRSERRDGRKPCAYGL